MNCLNGCSLAVVSVAAAAIVGSAPSQKAKSPNYPYDMLTRYTHSSPGGRSDVFLREMSDYFSDALGGVSVVVENVTGGSGANALAALLEQPADGSVFYATTPTFVFTTLMSDLQVGYEGIEPLMNVFYDPQVIYTRADAPWHSFNAVLEHAGENRGAWGAADPGSLERLKEMTGVDAAIVTSDGGGEKMINVLNGTLDVAMGELQEMRSQIDGGDTKILAVGSDDRLENYPDVPTLRDPGVDLVVRKSRGLAGPQGLPENVVAIWNEAIPRLSDDPEYREVYSELDLIPAFVPHEEYGPFIADFAEDNRSMLRNLGVRQE